MHLAAQAPVVMIVLRSAGGGDGVNVCGLRQLADLTGPSDEMTVQSGHERGCSPRIITHEPSWPPLLARGRAVWWRRKNRRTLRRADGNDCVCGQPSEIGNGTRRRPPQGFEKGSRREGGSRVWKEKAATDAAMHQTGAGLGHASPHSL